MGGYTRYYLNYTGGSHGNMLTRWRQRPSEALKCPDSSNPIPHPPLPGERLRVFFTSSARWRSFSQPTTKLLLLERSGTPRDTEVFTILLFHSVWGIIPSILSPTRFLSVIYSSSPKLLPLRSKPLSSLEETF